MIHVSVKDRYSTRAYAFAGDSVVVGNGPDVDLVLDKDGVAARHIQIVRRGDDLYIDDLVVQVTDGHNLVGNPNFEASATAIDGWGVSSGSAVQKRRFLATRNTVTMRPYSGTWEAW